MKPGIKGQGSAVKKDLMCAMRSVAVASLVAVSWPQTAPAVQPIVTDSRIKTFVYNPNEVFAVTTHYGYQSNIEFAEKETIETVSVGDRVGWQIIPSGRRLFIRAMEENAHTNMTIVTNLHAYQFDLRSSASDAVFGSEELTYVVRFYYPDAPNTSGVVASAADFTPPPVTAPTNYSAPMGYAPPAATPIGYTASGPATYAPQINYAAPSAPSVSALPSTAPLMRFAPTASASGYVPQPMTAPVASGRPSTLNYRYTYSGPSDAAPTKIYDDGASTYFRFQAPISPKIAVITARGERMDVPVRLLPDNVVAVDVVASGFSIQQPNGQIIVYNESGGA